MRPIYKPQSVGANSRLKSDKMGVVVCFITASDTGRLFILYSALVTPNLSEIRKKIGYDVVVADYPSIMLQHCRSRCGAR